MSDPLLSDDDDDLRECLQCEYPEHEGGMLAALDEWQHRRHSGWISRLFRPVCDLRDLRIRRRNGID